MRWESGWWQSAGSRRVHGWGRGPVVASGRTPTGLAVRLVLRLVSPRPISYAQVVVDPAETGLRDLVGIDATMRCRTTAYPVPGAESAVASEPERLAIWDLLRLSHETVDLPRVVQTSLDDNRWIHSRRDQGQ